MRYNKREHEFGEWLTRRGIKWEFNRKKFKIKLEWREKPFFYTPDVYLPETDEYIEVIGSYSGFYQGAWKHDLFIKQYPNIKYIEMDYRGYPYIRPGGNEK